MGAGDGVGGLWMANVEKYVEILGTFNIIWNKSYRQKETGPLPEKHIQPSMYNLTGNRGSNLQGLPTDTE